MKLIRESTENFRPKVTFIIGNGAIENGISPLINVLRSKNSFIAFSDDLEKDIYCSKTPFSSALSHAAFLFRAMAMELVDPNTNESHFNRCLQSLKEVRRFRYYLAREYRDSCLALRNPGRDILDLLLASSTAVITTNWDETLWRNEQIANVIQIHGRCSFPASIILPMELTVDESVFERMSDMEKYLESISSIDPKASEIAKGIHTRVKSCARPSSFRSELRRAHRKAISWIEEAETLVIWGSAVHAYDAELNSLIVISNHANATKKKAVFIVNPNRSDRDAVAGMLRVSHPVRRDIDPSYIWRRATVYLRFLARKVCPTSKPASP